MVGILDRKNVSTEEEIDQVQGVGTADCSAVLVVSFESFSDAESFQQENDISLFQVPFVGCGELANDEVEDEDELENHVGEQVHVVERRFVLRLRYFLVVENSH